MDYFQKNAQPYFCFEAKKLKNCQLSINFRITRGLFSAKKMLKTLS